MLKKGTCDLSFFNPPPADQARVEPRANGKPITKAEFERRKKLINDYMKEFPHASRAQVSAGTGLTTKQIKTTLKRAELEREKVLNSYVQMGRCVEMGRDCGPCDGCLGPCPKCHKPVRENQSRAKVIIPSHGWVTREASIHLGCKG